MTDKSTSLSESQLVVAGETLTFLHGGTGPTVLVLHDEWGIDKDDEIWQLLSGKFSIIAPIAPGFETVPTSTGIKSVRDLALFYNAALRQVTDGPVTVIGISLGAWIAMEMAVMDTSRIARLALLGPVGLRFGVPEQRNFADLFALDDHQLQETLYLNPSVARIASGESSREDAVAWARNREATALYGWEPYLHTPGLQRWTEHLNIPTLIIHGGDDRFVMGSYYEKFAASFANSAMVEIAKSGHYPHLEDPSATFSAIEKFSIS